MPSNPLLDVLQVMADTERKIKEFKRRLRVKGKVTDKGLTKKGNITLTVQRDNDDFKFTVLKSHKERFAIAQSLKSGTSVSIAGIPRFRIIICTQLKTLDKGLSKGTQLDLHHFE